MITAEQITKLIERKIEGTDMFIVEVSVRPGNQVDVSMDSDKGITIEACTDIHRYILHELDRDVEDYSLVVSSPDLDKPLKVKRQYVKNIGREFSVKKEDGQKLEGALMNAGEHSIVLTTSAKEQVPGKKTKQLVTREIEIPFEEIKEAKIKISFK